MSTVEEFGAKANWLITAKSAALGAVTLFLALVSGWEFKADHLIQAWILLAVFLITFVLQTVFLSRGRLVYLLTLIEALGLGFFFYNPAGNADNYIITVSFVIFVLFLLTSVYSAKRDLAITMKVGFYRLSGLIVSRSLIGLSIFLGAIYIFGGVTQLTARGVAENLSPISSMINYYYPAYNLSTSTDAFFKNIAAQNVPQTEFTQAQREQAINQFVSSEEAVLNERYFNGSLNPQKPLVNNFTNLIFSRFFNLGDTTKTALGIIALFLITVSVRSLGFIIYPVISLFSFLIFQLLTALNFAKVGLEDKSQEVIKLVL